MLSIDAHTVARELGPSAAATAVPTATLPRRLVGVA